MAFDTWGSPAAFLTPGKRAFSPQSNVNSTGGSRRDNSISALLFHRFPSRFSSRGAAEDRAAGARTRGEPHAATSRPCLRPTRGIIDGGKRSERTTYANPSPAAAPLGTGAGTGSPGTHGHRRTPLQSPSARETCGIPGFQYSRDPLLHFHESSFSVVTAINPDPRQNAPRARCISG